MNGIGVSPGISIGRAFIMHKSEVAMTGILLEESAIPAAIEKFDNAVRVSVQELEELKALIDPHSDSTALSILETQVEFLTDPEIRSGVVNRISEHKQETGDALITVIHDTVQLFRDMDDEYMSARSADIQDIGDRILKNLRGLQSTTKQTFEAGTIIIAEEITPSDTLAMDIRNIAGFATQSGGRTSHTAIIARSRGIPAIVGCGPELTGIRHNDIVILDGSMGMLLVNPGQEAIREYKKKQDEYRKNTSRLTSLKDKPAITPDGRVLQLTANISSGDDLADVFEHGGQGVGLFRTELLFMGRNSFPAEDEQFEFYKKAAIGARHQPVIVRTMDIGGDKQLAYFGLPAEENPFLGYRAIRISLDRKELFITQLKAILRAGIYGKLKIMFPMISDLREVRAARKILEEAKNELMADQVDFNGSMETGIMIEIPSAAITADILAKEVDFFSIGTNDLCQYTLAVDRMNGKIRDLYDPFNPGVLRLISNTIEQARKHNIHVGMCGEMAADPMATLLLMGMGLEEFSMSASSIPAIKQIIINNNYSTARELFQQVMTMDSSQDIKAYLQEHTL